MIYFPTNGRFFGGSHNALDGWQKLGTTRFCYLNRSFGGGRGARKRHNRALFAQPSSEEYPPCVDPYVAKSAVTRKLTLGMIHGYAGNSRQAVELLALACEHEPTDSMFRMEWGRALAGSGRMEDAWTVFVKAFELDPTDAANAVDIGYFARHRGDFRGALDYFQRATHLNADDWTAKTYVIQMLQALGELEKSDTHVRELYDLRARGAIIALTEATHFYREQLDLDVRGRNVSILVSEFFEMRGDWARKYVFTIYNERGEKRFGEISLGSYEFTNEAARALGDIGPDDRLFHLDGYWGDGEDAVHTTLGFFVNEPSYDTVREKALAILADEDFPLPF
jgi:Flp pilus assembly protein TadD